MIYRIVLRSIFALGLALLFSAAAQAQSFRTYLSRAGAANPSCSLASPCRLLPDALAAVIDGGEVWMLDSANYNTGPVNVDKSVTILAVPGALGSVVALGGNAINIATANVKVALRNLVIVPYVGGGGVDGINMTAGVSLTVDNCLIASLPQHGIDVSANGASVLVTDTMIRDNVSVGLFVRNGARATVSRSTFSGNITGGVRVQGGTAATTTTADIVDSTVDSGSVGVGAYSYNSTAQVKVSVRDSQVVRNSNFGFFVQSDLGALVHLSATNNIIGGSSTNGVGVYAWKAGVRVWVSGNTVTDTGTGFVNDGATSFESANDNALRNNTADTSGVIGPIAKL